MTPDSHPEVLCAEIIVADAIATPVDEPPEPGLLRLVDSVELATGGCALSTATASDVERALERARPRRLHIGGALVMPAPDGEPLAGVLRSAREQGVLTSLDAVHDASGRWDRLHASLPHLDLICPNLNEAQGISGQSSVADCAAWMRDRGASEVVVKLGRDGAYALDAEGGAEHVAPFEVTARDETGAGDAFAGGLLFALDQGWPLAEATRLANAVGALSTTAVGASTALPDLHDALAFAGLEAPRA